MVEHDPSGIRSRRLRHQHCSFPLAVTVGYEDDILILVSFFQRETK